MLAPEEGRAVCLPGGTPLQQKKPVRRLLYPHRRAGIDLFCAGIAGGSVTCEREYDTIYTERYMDTPQNNPEGYKLSSVLEGAENLHGRLLLVLGMLDDNVHPCNSWKFAHRLQNAQIQFELMAYPRTKHAYAGAHHYQLMRDFIRRNLKLVSETHPE